MTTKMEIPLFLVSFLAVLSLTSGEKQFFEGPKKDSLQEFVQSKLDSLSLRQKIGQMLQV